MPAPSPPGLLLKVPVAAGSPSSDQLQARLVEPNEAERCLHWGLTSQATRLAVQRGQTLQRGQSLPWAHVGLTLWVAPAQPLGSSPVCRRVEGTLPRSQPMACCSHFTVEVREGALSTWPARGVWKPASAMAGVCRQCSWAGEASRLPECGAHLLQTS